MPTIQHVFPIRPFWIKWTPEGLIQFGSGRQAGKHEILVYSDDNPILIETVQVSSFEAGIETWDFSQIIGSVNMRIK